MGVIKDIGVEIGKGVVKAFNTYLQAKMQTNKYLKWLTDYTYYGFDGGSIFGIREIYVDGDKILGMRNYTDEQDPVTNIDDLQFDNDIPGNKIIGYSSGSDVLDDYTRKGRWDGRFERGGSASRLTNNAYNRLKDQSSMRQRFQDTDLLYSLKYSKRRPLLDSNGNSTRYDVIDIPTSRGLWGGLFKDFDYRGYDLGRIGFRAVQTFIYKTLDKFIFDPLAEQPFRMLKEKTGEGDPLDSVISLEHNAINDVTKVLFDLPKDLEFAQ